MTIQQVEQIVNPRQYPLLKQRADNVDPDRCTILLLKNESRGKVQLKQADTDRILAIFS